MASGVLAALADPTRQRLLDSLVTHGAASATELAKGLPVSRQAVAQHLAVLDAAGLVHASRSGREVRYALRPDRVTATAAWLITLAARWDERLAAVAGNAEADRG